MASAPSPEIKRFGEHHNAFGFLRLLLASLVIVSHTPEMADGDRHREILARLFGSLSFGELAVDSFFIVSGYLIAGSFLKQPRPWPYLKKRIARIYPGFVLAFLLCALIVAPLAGGRPVTGMAEGIDWLKSILLLQAPEAAGAFAGTHYQWLDAPMWTIPFEFGCYILVLLLGLAGALRRPRLIVALSIALLACHWFLGEFHHLAVVAKALHLVPAYGNLVQATRLAGMFLAGASFFLFDGRIRYTRWRAVGAAFALIAFLLARHFVEPAIAVFGAYLALAVARLGGGGLLGRINNRNDVSYGVYLYAWPLEKLLLMAWPGVPLPVAAAMTFAAAFGCGWLSWHLVEKPAMKLVRRRLDVRSEALSSGAGDEASPEPDHGVQAAAKT